MWTKSRPRDSLTVEGIYRSSGVKFKITKLKAANNSRQCVKLGSYEPIVVGRQPVQVVPERVAGAHADHQAQDQVRGGVIDEDLQRQEGRHAEAGL